MNKLNKVTQVILPGEAGLPAKRSTRRSRSTNEAI